jgi:C-terminal processing protease CtpA/Prc
MPPSRHKPVEVSITRDLIRVRSVRSHLEDDDVGFIRVTQFNEQTTGDVRPIRVGRPWLSLVLSPRRAQEWASKQ